MKNNYYLFKYRFHNCIRTLYNIIKLIKVIIKCTLFCLELDIMTFKLIQGKDYNIILATASK